METWQVVWRKGFAPQLSTKSLEALRQALLTDDPRLVQGTTTDPPLTQDTQGWAVEAACALGYCGWRGDGLKTVGKVNDLFMRLCSGANQRLSEPAACRWFFNWFDDTPRVKMRRELLLEVQRELGRRAQEPDLNPEEEPVYV